MLKKSKIKVNWENKVRKFWRYPNESSFDYYFDIKIHDYESYYDIDFKNDVIIFPQQNMPVKDIEKYYTLLDTGIKFIIDCTYERSSYLTSKLKDYQTNGLVIVGADEHNIQGWDIKHFCFVPAMFWYTEYFRLNYETPDWEKLPVLNFNRINRKYDFLMPMLNKRPGKELILNLLKESYDMSKMLYSVGWENKFLPGELNDRYYNSKWYNSTLCTLVVETSCDYPLFITEKTFKPIIYGHPFIVFGGIGTLKVLKEKGFHTFFELFDESYDKEEDDLKRAKLVVEQIKKFNFDYSKKDVIDKKIYNNQNRFFNLELVLSNIDKDLRQPIEKFLYER